MAQKKECWNCLHYATYYTKGYTCFYKEKFGSCSVSNSIVENHDGCENWIRKYSVGKRRKAAALKALIDATETLNVIKQILSEDRDEL